MDPNIERARPLFKKLSKNSKKRKVIRTKVSREDMVLANEFVVKNIGTSALRVFDKNNEKVVLVLNKAIQKANKNKPSGRGLPSGKRKEYSSIFPAHLRKESAALAALREGFEEANIILDVGIPNLRKRLEELIIELKKIAKIAESDWAWAAGEHLTPDAEKVRIEYIRTMDEYANKACEKKAVKLFGIIKWFQKDRPHHFIFEADPSAVDSDNIHCENDLADNVIRADWFNLHDIEGYINSNDPVDIFTQKRLVIYESALVAILGYGKNKKEGSDYKLELY